MELHRWIVLASGTLAVSLSLGFELSLGNLFSSIMTTFNTSRTVTASIHSVMLATELCSGFICGILTSKLGSRNMGLIGAGLVSIGTTTSYFATSTTYLFVSLSLVTGFGICSLMFGAATAVEQHFQGRFGLVAQSILQSGSGIGGASYPYLLQYLTDKYDFRGTVLVVGSIVMNTVAFVLLWKSASTQRDKEKVKPNRLNVLQRFKFVIKNNIKKTLEPFHTNNYQLKHEGNIDGKQCEVYVVSFRNTGNDVVDHRSLDEHRKQTEDGDNKLASKCEIFRSCSFVVYSFGAAVSLQAALTLTVFVQDIYIDAGYTEDDASFAFLLFNLLVIVGNLLPGILYQTHFVSTLLVPTVASCLVSGSLLGCYFVQSLAFKHIFVSFCGLTLGNYSALFSIMPLKFFDSVHLSNAMGLVTTLTGIAVVSGGPFTGWLRDSTGSYLVPVIFEASLAMVAVGLFGIAGCVRKREIKSQNQELT